MPFDYEKYVRIWFDWVERHADVPPKIVADMEMLLDASKKLNEIYKSRQKELRRYFESSRIQVKGLEKVTYEGLENIEEAFKGVDRVFKLLKKTAKTPSSLELFRQVAEEVSWSLGDVSKMLQNVDRHSMRLGTSLQRVGSVYEDVVEKHREFTLLTSKAQATLRFVKRITGMLDNLKRRAEEAGHGMISYIRYLRYRFRLPVPTWRTTYLGIRRLRRLGREIENSLVNQLKWTRRNIQQEYLRGITMRELGRTIAETTNKARDFYETAKLYVPYTKRIEQAREGYARILDTLYKLDAVTGELTQTNEAARKTFRAILEQISPLETFIEEDLRKSFTKTEEDLKIFRRATESLAESPDAILPLEDEFESLYHSVKELAARAGEDFSFIQKKIEELGESEEAIQFLREQLQKLQAHMRIQHLVEELRREHEKFGEKITIIEPEQLPLLERIRNVFRSLQRQLSSVRASLVTALSPDVLRKWVSVLDLRKVTTWIRGWVPIESISQHLRRLRDDISKLHRVGLRTFLRLRRSIKGFAGAITVEAPELPALPPPTIFDRLQIAFSRLRNVAGRTFGRLRNIFASLRSEARETTEVNYLNVRSYYDLCREQRELVTSMALQYLEWRNVYRVVRDHIINLYRAIDVQKITGLTVEQMTKQINSLAKRITNMILAGKEEVEQNRSFRSSLQILGREIGRTSWRLSWFGYRMVIVGRILTRAWIPRVQDAVAALVNWQKTLPTVMLAIGMLAGTMNLTEQRFEGLWKIATKIIQQGPEMEAAWFHFSAALLGISVIIGEKVKPLLFALGDMLLRLAPIVETTLAPALQSLVDMIVRNLPLIERIITQALPAFAEGFKLGAQAMITFMKFLAPVFPMFAKLLGVMLAFAPVLEPVGHALYFIGTAATAVSAIIKLLTAEFTIFGHTISLTNPYVLAIIAAVTIAIYIFTHWKQIVEAVTNAFKWLNDRIKDATRWISNLGKTLREKLCFTHAAGYISEFNRELSRAIELSDRFQRQARSLGGAAVGVASGTTVATQHVTIISNVHIESISSSVDLEELESTINRAIAEAVRRRLG